MHEYGSQKPYTAVTITHKSYYITTPLLFVFVPSQIPLRVIQGLTLSLSGFRGEGGKENE